MPSADADHIAFEAARLVDSGAVESIGEAINQAAESLGVSHGELPGHGRVRQHLRGMAMQTMGQAEYAAMVREVLQDAEAVMTLLETTFDDVDTILAGRVAKGQIDGGYSIHIRLYTKRALREIAELMAERDYGEPAFETADTCHGRLDRIRFAGENADLVLTRCLPSMAQDKSCDLFSGEKIEVADLAELRKRIEALRIR